ncbi:hypothetical protein [Aquimarina algiphila]|uniref:hypothetical protein n=1 Tax=Aquimarina algiphila TaxID=2047982 RepID=UPI00248FD2CE|nr:hypothetical protein [Aquimarina algiphila]
MFGNNSALIDNWSLESSGALLDFNQKKLVSIDNASDEEFVSSFGALTNLINAIVFYDDIRFIDNGFQETWLRFNSFSQKISSLMKPYIQSNSEKLIEQTSGNKGADYYVYLSKQLNSDVYLSPERSSIIIRNLNKDNISISKRAIDLLNMSDQRIKNEALNLSSDIVKTGICKNFILPSILHYVMAESTTKDDLLDVAIQMRNSKEIEAFKKIIKESFVGKEINSIKLENEIKEAIDVQLGKISKDRSKDWQITFTLFFISIGKTFGWYKSENHLTFLKDTISFRTGLNNLDNHLERLFKIKIQHTH